MTWTLALDRFNHDLKIVNGRFLRVNQSDEVRQRVKVTVWQYFQEYFINIPNGTPWYESIMGRKNSSDIVSSILRNRILTTPGVIRIDSFNINFNELTRTFETSGLIQVQSGPNEVSTATSIDFTVNQGGIDG